MARTQHFSGAVKRSGRLCYITVPSDTAISLGSPGHAPVAGTANGKGIHAVVTMDARGEFRLLLNAATRDRIGLEVGDTVELIVTPDPTETAPPIPDDLVDALEAIEGSTARWEALAPAHQRELLIWIAESRSSSNRSRRLARTLARIWE